MEFLLGLREYGTKPGLLKLSNLKIHSRLAFRAMKLKDELIPRVGLVSTYPTIRILATFFSDAGRD